MNVDRRLAKLERTLGTEACDCPDGADFSWPGHQPALHCAQCAGKRVIYALKHKPASEASLRAALPIFSKAHDGKNGVRLDRLSDIELQQLKTALAPKKPNVG
jgi:hypothetical protein